MLRGGDANGLCNYATAKCNNMLPGNVYRYIVFGVTGNLKIEHVISINAVSRVKGKAIPVTCRGGP
jgi:hypothetical protein